MAVGLQAVSSLEAVNGIRIGVCEAGIRYKNRRDLVVFEISENAAVAATFTRNAFCAAPVQVAREHLASNTPRYLLINTGNANAGTGERGYADAQRSCEILAQQTGIASEQVLPFSTGVIGEFLPMEKLESGIGKALSALNADAWVEAAKGIMTTDTLPKGISDQIEIGGAQIQITGICKGAGMIRPNMATMLAFVATDARIDPELLQQCLSEAVDLSFNRITIDSDTSTNDSCVLIATQKAEMPIIDDATSAEYAMFRMAVISHCQRLAQMLVRDGEGATKFMTIEVNSGANLLECEDVAFTVAHSPLVKTAFYASDPNWGRILAAIGRSNVPGLNVDKIDVYLNEVCIVEHGCRASGYTEEQGQNVMNQSEITVRIELRRGDESATVWTTDFSHDYVTINAEYRS
ncbi:MAG: bifunctional glutamate N-acetyltransferase/amino-acid acetyltransferase ArgJ [Gammaproteobacteria bacterium]|nr:bifunctional glutamate N-acetyltransferase/amino-acid acetyltransferase ArgJ [Gammaproteobacteria bacterium]